MLSRVSGILAGRGFNIDSLVVARTEVADLSRMTIVLRGESEVVEQARRQLEDLVSLFFLLLFTFCLALFDRIMQLKDKNGTDLRFISI